MNRIGRFRIREDFIDAARYRGEAATIFDGMVVLRAEYDPMSRHYVYGAIHPQFDENPPECVAPWYEAIFEDGATRPTWRRTNYYDGLVR